MPRRPPESRKRRSTTQTRSYLARVSLDDPEALPAGPLPAWKRAALAMGRRQLEVAVTDEIDTFRVLRDADDGVPSGRILALGEVHTLYKAGGGFIEYQVPSSCKVSCKAVGCCNPARTISAGRL